MGAGQFMALKAIRTGNQTKAQRRSMMDHQPCETCAVRGIAVCGALSREELDKFGAEMSDVRLQSGDTLISEGDPEKHVFSVLSGCLKCYKLMPDGRRQITGFLFPGDFLGLGKCEENTFSAEAVGEVGLCRMERTRLTSLSGEIPNLKHRLYDLAAESLSELQDHILLLGRKTAQERVATFLLTLSKRAQLRGDIANPVEIPMGRDDIGDFLGLTTETVSRTFSRLRKAGIIGTDRDKRIQLINMEELESLAEGA